MFHVLTYLVIALILGLSSAEKQCNLGQKLYSVETGNSVCAPLAPYQCTHGCVWNSSCANTAHAIAFQGRRTFVAGMILTDNNFMILCCATLAHIVQQNQRLENRCVWVPETKSTEHNPSLRFDPPLSLNEYVRDMEMRRLGNGQVEIKTQICKFITQRTNCNETTMSEDDKQAYSLLQLRLSRTESFFKTHNGTDPREFFDLPTPQQTQRVDMKDVKIQTLPKHSAEIQLLKNSEPLFHDTDAVESEIRSFRPNQQLSPVPFAQQLPPMKNYLPARVHPIQAFVTEGNGIARHDLRPQYRQPSFRLRSINNHVNLPPRPGRLNGVAQLHTNIHSGELDENKERYYQPKAFADGFFSLSGSPDKGYHTPRLILSTNQSHEIVHKYRRAYLSNRFHQSYKPAPGQNSGDSSQMEERPFKSALAIRKLHLGAAKHSSDTSYEPISFGGSFGSGSNEFLTARNLRTFNNLRPFSSHKFPEDKPGLFPPRPPTLIFEPTHGTKTIVHPVDQNKLSVTYQTSHTTYRPRIHNQHLIAPTVKTIEQPVHSGNAEKQESLNQLLNCCQQQAPGCRHLCTPNVSKEQIKHAINTNECPPLSMTSVLQCFPRFYDIQSVSQCCREATQVPTPQPSINSLLTPSPRLPQQCQSLCEKDFKLTFAHLSCIDHIETISTCYRDILVN